MIAGPLEGSDHFHDNDNKQAPRLERVGQSGFVRLAFRSLAEFTGSSNLMKSGGQSSGRFHGRVLRLASSKRRDRRTSSQRQYKRDRVVVAAATLSRSDFRWGERKKPQAIATVAPLTFLFSSLYLASLAAAAVGSQFLLFDFPHSSLYLTLFFSQTHLCSVLCRSQRAAWFTFKRRRL